MFRVRLALAATCSLSRKRSPALADSLGAGPVFAGFDVGVDGQRRALVRPVVDRDTVEGVLAGVDAQARADGERLLEPLVGAVGPRVQRRRRRGTAIRRSAPRPA